MLAGVRNIFLAVYIIRNFSKDFDFVLLKIRFTYILLIAVDLASRPGSLHNVLNFVLAI